MRRHALMHFLKVGVGLAAIAVTMAAHSQDWPSRPVRVISPFATGGGGDTLARLVMDRISVKFGQQFFVENRPGAGATLGADVVAKSRADGYTLLVSGASSLAVGPVFMGASFDPVKDFTHIALFGGLLQSLAVHPVFPPRTLQDHLKLSHATRGGIAFGSPGTGSHTHLIGEMFRRLSGGNLLHVPYRGGGPLSIDLVAGHIPSAFMTLSASAPLVRSGKLRLLAISAKKRIADFPAVPTFLESGYSQLVATTWFSLSAPAGLPPEIAARLNAEVRAVLAEPEMVRRLDSIGVEREDFDPAAFTKFVQDEIKRWAPLAQAVKLSSKK